MPIATNMKQVFNTSVGTIEVLVAQATEDLPAAPDVLPGPHQPGREVSGLVGVEHGVVDVAQRVHVHEAGPDERVALVRIDVDGPGEGATDVDDPVTVVDDFAVLVDDVVASVVSDDEASPDPGPHGG